MSLFVQVSRTSPMHGLNPKIEPKADIASGKLGKM